MTWVRSDDNEPNHPKIFRAGVAAYGFFQAAKCYCARYLTDGFIPVGDLSLIFTGVPFKTAMKLTIKLVECGLFDKQEAPPGWRVHDYLDYNWSREQVAARRDQRIEAGKAGGRRSGEARRLASDEAAAKRDTKRVASPPANPIPIPIPTKEELDHRGAANGSSPPPVFQIPPSIETALGKCPTLGAAPGLHAGRYWQAQVRSKPGVNFAVELLEAEAWVVANPGRAPKKSVPAFMNRWFRKAYEDLKV